MNTAAAFYPVGTPGQPWGAPERAQWLARQTVQRSYAAEVVSKIDALRERFDVSQYGELDYPSGRYPLFAIRSRNWDEALPVMLVTGGVHGYETSGVQGALQFVDQHAADYTGRCNLLIAPCVSPWGYERIQRWNALALDPNRSFVPDSPAQESAALMALVAPLQGRFLVHIDLHETTDSDESEFRPALAARDGKPFEPGEIPDGFYLCADSLNPQPAFQQAVNAEVAKVTHIAPADAQGRSSVRRWWRRASSSIRSRRWDCAPASPMPATPPPPRSTRTAPRPRRSNAIWHRWRQCAGHWTTRWPIAECGGRDAEPAHPGEPGGLSAGLQACR